MKHHSQQELDEKIHAFLASKADIIPDMKLTATDATEHNDRKRGYSFFSPFIALDTRFSK